MTIWILALVLFACLAALGYNQGVIRVAFSFLGLLIGSLLAMRLGHLLYPLLHLCGVQNPLLLWLLGPFLVFCLILTIFRVAGFAVHQKADVYYKYKAGDIRMGLWNRISHRLGLCLGLANAAVYLILISLVVYVLSYPLYQMAGSESAPFQVKMLNLMGRNVYSPGTGMSKISAAIDPMPEAYYQASDVIGLLYHNDLLEGRLSRYPAFLSLAERQEFQDIGNDKEFTELRQRQAPIGEILNHPKAQAIVNNPDLLNEIWATAVPNLKDLQDFLRSGRTAKYDDEKILGRWNFDLNGAMALYRKMKPNVSASDTQRFKKVLALTMAKASFVATPEKEAYLKSIGHVKPAPPNSPPNTPPSVDSQSYKGQWANESGFKYKLTLPGKEKDNVVAEVDGDRLSITGDAQPLAFTREF